MKLKKNSLIVRIWLYLIIFSISILLFLWLFQVIFLDQYYEWYKTKAIKKVASDIIYNYDDEEDFTSYLEKISYSEGICIEIFSTNNNINYSSNMNKSCFIDSRNPVLTKSKNDFIKSGDESIIFKVVSQENTNSIIYGLKLDSDYYIFLNTLLDPVDSTITILKKQLIIVTIIIIIFSTIIAYFISNKLSRPIMSLNESAKKFAKGDNNVVFPNTDIAEISELSNSLNYAKKELEKTDELRKDLLANVSHDLKTPLTMIKAYTEMVRDITYKDNKKRNENLNVIIEEVDRLNLLVSDILALSSIQSNINELEIESFNIIKLINSIINRFKIYSFTEDYSFIYLFDKEEIMVSADKKKIEQVIYNLIGNAVNYAGKDKKITIRVMERYDDIKIEISDNGKGIDEKDLDKIWDKYTTQKKQYKRNMIGTGLGLSIVKNILEKHNFKYGVNSIKNKGTTFYFEIKKD